jgi:hypothetical protein
MKKISGWILPLLRRSINNPESEKVFFLYCKYIPIRCPQNSNFWEYSGKIPLISSQIFNNENDFPIIETLILQSVL